MNNLFIILILLAGQHSYKQSAQTFGRYHFSGSDTIKLFEVKVRLVREIKAFDCGVPAVAVAQKFEIIESRLPVKHEKYIVIIQPCPELSGRDFFRKGKIYTASISLENKLGYTILNSYKNEKLHTYWSQKIIETRN